MLQKSFTQPLGYTLAAKPGLFPAAFGEGLHYADSHDMIQSSTFHRHDRTCPRVAGRRPYRERSRSSGCIEKSITSLHSSGQDSGIVDNTLHCQCGQSSSQSSEESSNYEDSLQSVPQRKTRSSSIRQVELDSSRTNTQQRRSRNRSISEDVVQSGGLHRIRSLGHIPAPPPMVVSGPSRPSTLRRSSDRLIVG